MPTLLMVDDHHILYRSGTERVLHHPTRHEANPLISPDRPWDGAVAWTSVYRNPDSGRYQMWYQGFVDKDPAVPQATTCYAESDDGIHFTKPRFDLISYGEHRETNIVMVGSGGTSSRYANAVIVDDRDPDQSKRYKMAYFDFETSDAGEYPGLCVAFSPDGIHWSKPDIPMPVQRIAYGNLDRRLPFRDEPGSEWSIPLSTSDARDVFYDTKREEFVDYGKMWLDGPAGNMAWKHAMGRTASKDFIHWSKPELVLAPDDQDLPHVEFHTSPVFLHADCYIALTQILNRADRGGTIDIELMLSRDGFRWERPFRDDMFMKNRDGQEFESGSIFTNATPVILDDEIRFYYGAYSMGATGWDNSKQVSGVGMATIPRDRFAGVRSVALSDQATLSEPLVDTGQVTLKPLDFSSCAGITLNADASAGEIRVELLDAGGYRLPGFTRDDSVPIAGDSLRHPVRWTARGGLPRGEAMLRIHLKRAELFAVDLVEK